MTPSRHSSHDLPSMTCNGDDQQMAYVFVSLQRPVLRLTVEFMPDLYIAELYRLQQIQNSLARAVVKAPKSSHITPILQSLHWLKINERIEYKLSFTYKVLTTSQPSYLNKLVLAVPASHRLSPLLAHQPSPH